ncbi:MULTISPECIES: acyl-CoA dehydrogenase [unclassified Luteimonas]|uniref:acyl-CoA dehydrogenase family protein n=1 Tax=unclassified Luteimonas TaxID=2629088 RepID=UPI0018F085B6|nr:MULTISPECIES: acyl-CoA dehydrogenase [unclassified Luteimonas]MBJ6978370.1 acyl-CoA dehydrogenase family protein [Luteimonas sp. MC1895]MBJ6983848.1 acyl-CoA dehydrogenase family protein [Luteimonas sp. MC1750]QQO06671.1 acyl-CoA dehydrogenase family protein [Luteimonas sp. MC1750]
MDVSFTEEQQMLHDSIRRYLASDYPLEHRAKTIAGEDGWSADTWRALADLGLLALDIEEADGGIGAGPVGTMLVSQATGAGLLLEPFHSSAVLATRVISLLGQGERRTMLLDALASGDAVAVLAHDEDGGWFDARSTTAEPDGDGWRLHGRKARVYHAPMARWLLVSARTQDGSGVFLVERDAEGMELRALRTVDGQRAADIELDLHLPADARLGGEASAALEQALDHGLAALCADALGVLDRTLATTVQYTRDRVQFGTPIGRFQALQHRMADMYMQVEQARSMSYLATSACLGDDAQARREAVSGAKVVVGQAARRVGQEAVQLHGGMGMTDELDVSHCFRRLLAFELRMGTTDEHLRALHGLARAEAA